MSFQPMPYAKRQKVTSDSPNLAPSAPHEPHFYRPIASTSTAGSSSSSYTRASHDKQTESRSKYENSHGSFTNYYKKRRGQLDADGPDLRLALVPQDWWKGAKVLDVGCNSGAVTVEVGQRFDVAKVNGVDIDDGLIGQCHHSLKLAWSRQRPLQHLVNGVNREQPDRDLPPHLMVPPEHDELASGSSVPETDYFPLALPRMYGFVSLPPKHAVTVFEEVPEVPSSGTLRNGARKVMPREKTLFPANVAFETADWVTQHIRSDKTGYDIILALSVTKWIHLHGLNEGLFNFFTKCFTTLRPGGKLILEPQAFSTYPRSARKGGTAEEADVLKTNLEKLRTGEGDDKGWRHEDGDFERVLLERIGFEKMERLGEVGKQGFRRPVEVYHKRGGSWL